MLKLRVSRKNMRSFRVTCFAQNRPFDIFVLFLYLSYDRVLVEPVSSEVEVRAEEKKKTPINVIGANENMKRR
jgi:hypothetical protein